VAALLVLIDGVCTLCTKCCGGGALRLFSFQGHTVGQCTLRKLALPHCTRRTRTRGRAIPRRETRQTDWGGAPPQRNELSAFDLWRFCAPSLNAQPQPSTRCVHNLCTGTHSAI